MNRFKGLIVAAGMALALVAARPVTAAWGCSASDYYEMLNEMNGQPHTQEGADAIVSEFQQRCSAEQWFEAQAYVTQYAQEHYCGQYWWADPYCAVWLNVYWDGIWSYLASHSGG